MVKCLHCHKVVERIRGRSYCSACYQLREQITNNDFEGLQLTTLWVTICCQNTGGEVTRIKKPLLASLIRYIGIQGKLSTVAHYFYNQVPTNGLTVWIETVGAN